MEKNLGEGARPIEKPGMLKLPKPSATPETSGEWK